MPCSKGMRGCRADCSHRKFVLSYTSLRDEQLVRAEAATGGYDTETEEYFGPDGKEERWTFQRYLRHYSGEDYPYPDPNRRRYTMQMPQSMLADWAQQRIADGPKVAKMMKRQGEAVLKMIADKGCACNPTISLNENIDGPSVANPQITHAMDCTYN